MEATGVAVVTGAGRGIGRAVAIELARRGFDVVATMRNPADGEGLADDVGGAGNIRVDRLDVNDPSTMHMPDGLRVLVNNAGVESDNLPLEVMPADAWRSIFETNVFGLVEVTKHAIPLIRDAGGGVICNVTSSSLLAPVPFLGAYRSSKAAVSAIGESLAAEVAQFGIRVLEILPGPIETGNARWPPTSPRPRSSTSATAPRPNSSGKAVNASAACTRPRRRPRVASPTRSSTTTPRSVWDATT